MSIAIPKCKKKNGRTGILWRAAPGHAPGPRAAAHCTAPERTRKVLRAAEDRLATEQAALVRQFAREPWFYCLFRILEHEQGQFFTILDLDTGEERLLYSGAVRSLQRTGVTLFLALMFSNGSCLQTFGPVRYYRGFQPYDFQYFTRLLAVQAGTPAL